MGEFMIYQDVKFTGTDSLVLGDGVQTDSVKPTASTAYKRGDLLKIDENNVATHGTPNDWNVVCLADVTANEADKALSAKCEIPVYTQGEINVLAVSINGTKLNDSEQTQARAVAHTKTAIELRKPFGAK